VNEEDLAHWGLSRQKTKQKINNMISCMVSTVLLTIISGEPSHSTKVLRVSFSIDNIVK